MTLENEDRWRKCKKERLKLISDCGDRPAGLVSIFHRSGFRPSPSVKSWPLRRFARINFFRRSIGSETTIAATSSTASDSWPSKTAPGTACSTSGLLGLPPVREQARIVAKVDELMAVCDRLDAILNDSQNASQRLLEAMLHEAITLVGTAAAGR